MHHSELIRDGLISGRSVRSAPLTLAGAGSQAHHYRVVRLAARRPDGLASYPDERPARLFNVRAGRDL